MLKETEGPVFRNKNFFLAKPNITITTLIRPHTLIA
jgi:hypothetical protein